MITENQKLQLAKIFHYTNMGICIAYGDTSQKSWEEAEEWQRQAALDSINSFIELYIQGKPISAHEIWVENKIKDGWKYGPVKDGQLKTHPMLIPVNELPFHEKLKDGMLTAVFLTFVNTLKNTTMCDYLDCSNNGTVFLNETFINSNNKVLIKGNFCNTHAEAIKSRNYWIRWNSKVMTREPA